MGKVYTKIEGSRTTLGKFLLETLVFFKNIIEFLLQRLKLHLSTTVRSIPRSKHSAVAVVVTRQRHLLPLKFLEAILELLGFLHQLCLASIGYLELLLVLSNLGPSLLLVLLLLFRKLSTHLSYLVLLGSVRLFLRRHLFGSLDLDIPDHMFALGNQLLLLLLGLGGCFLQS